MSVEITDLVTATEFAETIAQFETAQVVLCQTSKKSFNIILSMAPGTRLALQDQDAGGTPSTFRSLEAAARHAISQFKIRVFLLEFQSG